MESFGGYLFKEEYKTHLKEIEEAIDLLKRKER